VASRASTRQASPAASASSTLALLEHLARTGRRASEHLLAPSGLRPRHVVALTLLNEAPAGQQDLADVLQLDPSNVVGLLNELEDAGLVVRRRDPADRRRHIVEISDTGAAELRAVQCSMAGAEAEVLAALTPDERSTLNDLLLRAAGGRLPTGACLAADDEC
jgi:DNA-binding MarR family transcriptional regulator